MPKEKKILKTTMITCITVEGTLPKDVLHISSPVNLDLIIHFLS